MAITKEDGRQHLVVAYVDIEYDDLQSGIAANAIELPIGAIVAGGDIIVSEAWNSGTSDALIVGDSSDDDRYTSSSVDLQSTGRTALTITGYQCTYNTRNIAVKWTGVGSAPSSGQARLMVQYYVPGRTQHTIG